MKFWWNLAKQKFLEVLKIESLLLLVVVKETVTVRTVVDHVLRG